jgi:hypothetical protein
MDTKFKKALVRIFRLLRLLLPPDDTADNPFTRTTINEIMNKQYLNEAAKAIDANLPDTHGFILLAVPRDADGRLNYISNLDRTDAINVLKEWLIKCGAEEDWMKHIK